MNDQRAKKQNHRDTSVVFLFQAHLFPQVKSTERQERASLTVFACAVALLPWRDETTLLKQWLDDGLFTTEFEVKLV